MSIGLREVHTYIVPETFPPIRYKMSQTSPMQTQYPHYVPQDCGAKQTNTLIGQNKPHTRGSTLISFMMTHSQLCSYYPL